jgi:hypothetical protein
LVNGLLQDLSDAKLLRALALDLKSEYGYLRIPRDLRPPRLRRRALHGQQIRTYRLAEDFGAR